MLNAKTLAVVDSMAAKYQPPVRNISAADYEPTRDAIDSVAASARFDSAKCLNDDILDNHRNTPRPDATCLYGLVGDVARAGGDTTEANPYAVAANFIAFMSCAIGRGPYMPVGNTWHHARMFALHIGRSGRGRKGDAVSLISRIERALKALSQDATPQVHRGGLSSREGLVYLIHDGFKEGKTEVEPVLDKRLLVIESEFANVLHQGKRDGNTLSAALRDCWDGVSMKPATKTSRLWATDPHCSGQVISDSLIGFFDVDLRSKALGDMLPSFECSLVAL